MNQKTFLILLVFTFLPMGCSTDKMAVRMALPLIQGQYLAIHEEMDPDLAERAIPSNLKMMEGFLRVDESNLELLQNLSEGFCGYAFSFVEDANPERASDLYLRGRAYALRALAAGGGGKDLTRLALEDFRAALERMNQDQVPALFWTGQCWGRWLMLNLDNPEAFADISKVEWLMQRVLELDEGFYFAGPHLFLGVFYGSRTKLLGGDPDKSRAHFEKNLAMTDNKYLLTHFLYARTYSVQTQNRELFDKLLDTVLKTPSDILPGQRLANEVAKTKAKKLLESADELF